MNIIHKLDPHVADLIAAGEVVERPASVVKELLENSFDAGATQVTVEIQRGGMGLIRVTDNGCGMSPEDAGTAFLRHATSKLRDARGLEAIGTLGFRGEALAAIAAVSRVQLLTRERGAQEGTVLTLEAGEEISRSPAGCPEGTTILVRDLFYNTPARLKFMRKDSAEGSSVTAAALSCAMSHPNVAVRYLREGKEEFHTPGNGRLDAVIYSLLGREFAKTMLPAQGSGDGITVEGYICPPANARGNRKQQYFFVNGRYVKSLLLQTALEQAYKNQLFTGRFPACVLFLELRRSAVDVNVHPAKTEVRFLQERQVFDAVYRSVQAALRGEAAQPELHLPKPEETEPVPEPEVREGSAPAAKPKGANPVSGRIYSRESVPKAPPADMPKIVEQLVFRQPAAEYGREGPTPREEIPVHRVDLTEPAAPKGEPELPAPKKGPEPPVRSEKRETPEPEPEAPAEKALPPYRILGEAFREYAVVETEEGLLLIDKHAAHERILFDRLKAGEREPMSQQLLEPQVVKPGAEDTALLLDHLPLLEDLGLEAEDFGGGALLVRRLPEGVGPEDCAALLEDTAEALRLGKRPGSLGQRDEVLASMACKAAVKAGMEGDLRELIPVVEAVLSGRVKYCPHGRPVSMVLTKAQLDRNFKRTGG